MCVSGGGEGRWIEGVVVVTHSSIECNIKGRPSIHTSPQIIKHDFGLTIDLEELLNKIDADGSGEIEFEEFKRLLS